MKGEDALPFVDMIDASNIDLLLVSHFHLDHAGALPWFLQVLLSPPQLRFAALAILTEKLTDVTIIKTTHNYGLFY